jgi:hypothetical protein
VRHVLRFPVAWHVALNLRSFLRWRPGGVKARIGLSLFFFHCLQQFASELIQFFGIGFLSNFGCNLSPRPHWFRVHGHDAPQNQKGESGQFGCQRAGIGTGQLQLTDVLPMSNSRISPSVCGFKHPANKAKPLSFGCGSGALPVSFN